VLEVRPQRKGRRRSSRHTARRKWLRYALLVFAAGLLVAGGLAVYRAKPLTQPRRGQEVIVAGQRMVRESLPGGRTAAFCAPDETVVEAFPDGKVRVSGWVDLIGQDGKAERQSFSVVVYRNADNQWVGEAVTVTPQML
jgi:hypothetical protein